MGKKIDSIVEMYNLGLPAPRCVFIYEDEVIYYKLRGYINSIISDFYTIRTDKKDNSMSNKRLLTATKCELVELCKSWHDEGYQIILQEFIDEKNEIKSGNIYLLNNKIIIEGAKDKHIRFANGLSLDVNIELSRFDSYDFKFHEVYCFDCFTYSELIRLVRLARRIPYTKAIVEFSFFNDDKLYFWEIKKEKIK